eukprot:1522611-Amphidinium_carterae.3
MQITELLCNNSTPCNGWQEYRPTKTSTEVIPHQTGNCSSTDFYMNFTASPFSFHNLTCNAMKPHTSSCLQQTACLTTRGFKSSENSPSLKVVQAAMSINPLPFNIDHYKERGRSNEINGMDIFFQDQTLQTASWDRNANEVQNYVEATQVLTCNGLSSNYRITGQSLHYATKPWISSSASDILFMLDLLTH